MRTRDAILPDAEQIHRLISAHFETGTLLPRSFAEICENIRDFVVAEDKGRIVGCGALHLYGLHLAEIRSIMVDSASQGKGAGLLLVKSLLRRAEKQRVSSVCLFTRIPDFFARLGFSVTTRDDIPDKLYKDCCACPKLHCCDEVAMVRGALPDFAILRQPMSALVKLEA
ncbi:MAG: N-acetyltransferase [Acidobacteriia bacterium]|nr:N-acetyltransferase [Terriglobia bacterium]